MSARLRWTGVAICAMAVLAACSSDPVDQVQASPTIAPTPVPAAPTVAPTPVPIATAVAPTPVPAASTVAPTPGTIATAVPALTPVPTATLDPADLPADAPLAPLAGVRPIGDLVAAPPGTFITARPDAGMPHVRGGNVVPVYDVPNGEPRVLVDRNTIDMRKLQYPLLNPTVFDQPLVLRLIAGEPDDEWWLVHAPVRPHRQHVWVRADDFVYEHTNLRIEVDLGRSGRLALIDGDQEVITSLAVYGRESRPTVLHDTHIDQVFEGSKLSPAYGTYILTMASYSESLGTYGGGGLPGQSIHGTNQPELIGQRVSSGGIRVSNEVIDFIYQQPGILGASVLIYDSTGIGREAAIALQRNTPWSPALTNAMTDAILQDAVPVASYS